MSGLNHFRVPTPDPFDLIIERDGPAAAEMVRELALDLGLTAKESRTRLVETSEPFRALLAQRLEQDRIDARTARDNLVYARAIEEVSARLNLAVRSLYSQRAGLDLMVRGIQQVNPLASIFDATKAVKRTDEYRRWAAAIAATEAEIEMLNTKLVEMRAPIPEEGSP